MHLCQHLDGPSLQKHSSARAAMSTSSCSVSLYYYYYFFCRVQVLALACVKFLAHLVNQQVAHEVVALELLMLLLEKPTDDSVEMAVAFVKECGQALTELSPKGCQGEYSHSLVARFPFARPF